MNKFQSREAQRAIAALPVLGIDYAARALSALHRAAMRASQKKAIAELARAHGVTGSPDWII
jgi:2-hydroxychromene-2-carboxylate isomerase